MECNEKFNCCFLQRTDECGPGGKGTYRILAINSGTGNGWQFSAEVLKNSLTLWDGLHCYVDHHQAQPSIRHLAGICHQPQWADAQQGISLELQAMGPSGTLLKEIADEVLQHSGENHGIGFSADILFQAEGRKVNRIVKVLSLDLVVNPARGGAFIEQLQNQEGNGMNEIQEEKQDQQEEELNPGNQQEQHALPAGEQDAYWLNTALAAARLPQACADEIRRQFQGKTLIPAELDTAIQAQRRVVSALTGRESIKGSSRIEGMFSAEDQLQAAVNELFGMPADPAQHGLKAARLSGIRELYMLLTGDYDLHGGIVPERVQFATTADFSGLVKNAMNKLVANTWDELGRAGYDWWQRVVSVEHFNSLHNITGTLVGTVGSLPVVSEGAAYSELVVGDSPETAQFTKYGGYIPLTLELIDRDETRKLRAYPRELAAAGLRKISELVAGIFTVNSGAGPNMADGGALFNTTSAATAGGHQNLGTTALAPESWESASSAIYDQPMLVKNDAGYYGSGPKMALNPRYLLVPRSLQLAAMKILYPSLENSLNIVSENLQRGQPGDVVTVPEWSDANDWAAACDPRIAAAIFVGERFGLMPEVFIAGNELSGAVFTNDEHRLKVRHFLAVWVNDFRPLFKGNVA
ncbi:MAG: hypothetical protein JEZ00_07725 [Anaerolineaceae bacterium]|nr:hypothetical protein [Anaerolineaceae bacterium]